MAFLRKLAEVYDHKDALIIILVIMYGIVLMSGCATSGVVYTSETWYKDGTPETSERIKLNAQALASSIEKAKQGASIDVLDNYKVKTNQSVEGLDSTAMAIAIVDAVGKGIGAVTNMSPATVRAFRGRGEGPPATTNTPGIE
jgi:hypothetical protein